jgi:protocatechuate 3,4-dioxygenase beta subunit
MSSINLATTIHVCEDTNSTFDVRDILTAAGYTAHTTIKINALAVTLPNGTMSTVDTPLFGKVDADTIYVRPGAWAENYNGKFATFEFVLDQGSGISNNITLSLQVIVDPVNDAPTGADKVFSLGNGAPVVLSQGDFGFVDAVEHDAFQSVIITSLPVAGQLKLDGVAVAAGAEISAADIAAGKLSFEPSQSTSGSFDIGFKVRDAGGLVGCGAADTSATPNYLTFKVPQAHLGDFVWEDSNGNGVQDSGEAGLAGVTVQLKDADGHVVATTTTDGSGQYHFDVNAGTYTVNVAPPAGYVATAQGQGGNGATDSDINASGSTGAIALAPGVTNNTADAGLYRPVSLGDTVWYDKNRNGVQDSGETGVAGVKVTLLDADGNPVSGATATTDASGHYQFSNLKPGTYSVQFDKATLPADYEFTSAGQGSDAGKDSDADIGTGKTAQVTLKSGENTQHLDAGIVIKQATVGDRVWEDTNGNGVQDSGEQGIDGATVTLKDSNGNTVGTVVTHDGGQYSFTVDPGTYSVSVGAPAGYVATGSGLGGNSAADSDIDASGNSSAIVLKPGQVNNDVDAGFYRPASLGNKVWYDSNRNGVQDSSEAGVAGVKVVLLDASGNPTGATATTDASGNYSFTNLKPGTYSVQFDKVTLPANYDFTSTGQGDGATDSDANTSTGKTGQVTLNSGDSNQDLDAGIVIRQATVGDRVWEDTNGNGVQDSGEQGVDGATVSLKDSSGNVVSTVVTHDGGQYSFTVDPGTYTVSVAPPVGYALTGAGQGGNGALDSDVDANGNASVTLQPGQNNADIDAGVYRPASLSQVVWFDADRDGRLNNGEVGAAGVKVTLLDASGNPVAGAVATTDASGHYQFTNLKPGTYSVQFDKSTLPAGYDFTSAAQGAPGNGGSDADTGSGKTAQVTLASGEDMTLRAGLVVQQATLGDRVWEDKNGNGVQDAGEAGIVGVKVDLKDASGNIVKTTTTGADGKYSFTVDPGKYSISVTAPTGMSATGQHGGADGVDSDINAIGQSDLVTLTAGQTNNNVDAGFYKGATLGDRVWLDANRNGLQDSGETGVAGVKVVLLDAAGNATGSTATTDANGNYSFTNLKPGTYSVQFDKATLPANYVFTGADAGSNDTKDSDANVSTGKTANVTLNSGDVYSDLDAGIVVVQAKLGDTVWEDKNGNGVQDTGEAGIAGVNVQLKDSTGKVVQTTTTAADGKYSFTADPGAYTVSVTAPSGYQFTGKDVGSDDNKDSDFGSNGQSGSITLNSGDNNTSVDAGLFKYVSVGDRVWLDTNKNGVQDSGEAGLCGVKVTLLDADGKQVGASVSTDVNGNYTFSNLKPGSYTVVFDKASLPEGMAFTSANQGTNDATDSDVSAAGVSHVVTLTSGQVDKSVDAGVLAAATIGDRVWIDKNGNGVQDDGESGKSGVTVELKDSTGKVVKTTTTDSNGNYKFSVEAGTYAVNVKAPSGFYTTVKDAGSNDAADSDADSSGNLGSVTVSAGQNVTHMDAGLYQKAEVGDKVWYDLNGDGIQQSGEAGAKGVKVTLLNEKGVAIATDVTDSSGLYSFTDLAPGKYSVKFSAVDGYAFTKQNQGSSDSADSDADASGVIAQFSLTSGQVDKTRDAGLVKLGSIGNRVWEDSNYNGVQDSGEKGVDGVTVKLYDAATGALKGTTVTHDGGQYLFDDLVAGNYKVEVTNGSGWYFTKSGQGTDATDSDITTVSGSTGKTGSIALGVGQDITTEDAGIYRKASIGDKVWRDANHNGIQDSGEEAIGGISVALFDASTGKQVGATIKTDSNGNYKFSELNPGNYYLQFDKTDVKVYFSSDKTTYNMNNWKWGVKNTGSNDGIDSDVKGDAKDLTNVTKTDTITLTSGKNDMSWDAAITPIAIDLNGDGIHTIAREDMTGSFDLLGTGKAIQSGWLSKNDGFLAIDNNGNGQIDDISELFGGASKGSGFAKLASYDSNADGVVNAADTLFASLRIWQDANSNGKTDAGELLTLSQAGVTSLTVAYTELPFLDANNNLHLERSSVTLANGKTADMTDVYFNVAASDAAAAGVTTPTIADLMQEPVQLVGQCPVAIA